MAAVKRCGECKRHYPLQAIVCLECEEILEENSYLKFVWISIALSLVADLALVQLGVLQRWRIAEVLQFTGFLVFVGYPLWKVVQKIREPERPILRELGSIYTGRFDRALITTMLLAVALVWLDVIDTGGVATSKLLVNPEHVPIVRMFALTLMIIAIVSSIAMIIDQGLSFFDPRVKNTYIARERAARN